MKQWLAITTMALAAASAHAGPFTTWDLNGSSVLLDTPVADGTIRLTSDGANQVGTAWAPGSLDWSAVTAGTSVSLSFAYAVSGAQGGDGLALFVTSGDAPQNPTGLFGLGAEDDGVALFLRTAINQTGSALAVNYPSSALELDALSAATTINLLAPVVYGKLDVAFAAGNGAKFTLSLSTNQTTWKKVAVASLSDLSLSFDDVSRIRVGFGASTSSSTAHFDLLTFSGPEGLVPVTPAVPEPASIGLMLAGLAALGARRLVSARRSA